MKSKRFFFLLLAFGIFFTPSIFAKENPKEREAGKNQSPPRVTGTDLGTYGMININNWELWLEDNGRSGYNPFISGDGGVFPKGTSFVIFQDGFIYGGKMVDAATGQLTAWPLPSHGQEIRNIDIQLSVNPPAVWFINQRLGRVIRFQEYEP